MCGEDSSHLATSAKKAANCYLCFHRPSPLSHYLLRHTPSLPVELSGRGHLEEQVPCSSDPLRCRVAEGFPAEERVR